MTDHLTTANQQQLTTFTATPGASVDVAERVIEGLAVPYGQPGSTSSGPVVFSKASDLEWPQDMSRIKLLREHNQGGAVVGYGLDVTDTPAGPWVRFAVPPGDVGDQALAEAKAKLRDGLSIGALLSADTIQRLQRNRSGSPVAARGRVREVSLVSVPAFDDARVGASAAANLTTASTEGNTPPMCLTCGHHHAPGAPHLTVASTPLTTAGGDGQQQQQQQQQQPEPQQLQQVPTDQNTTHHQANVRGQQVPTVDQDGRAVVGGNDQLPAPREVRASYGQHVEVLSEPTTYEFAGHGHSIVRDLYEWQTFGNAEAAGRVHRFNAELTDGNPASVQALTTAAVAVREDVPDSYLPERRLPLDTAPPARRPIFSRLNVTPITNADPFLIPVEGEFVGVGDHVEGTAHVAEGVLSAPADMTFVPRAVSGAYRLSRELAESSNPAVDAIAVRAMTRDYDRQTEAKAWLAITTAVTAVVADVSTPMALRDELIDFVSDDEETADFVLASKELQRQLFGDTDTTDRPQLPFIGTVNAVGQINRAGYTGVTIDGVELVRAARVPAPEGVIVQRDAIMAAESRTQQFRFEQAEGPGIIKLALWGYVGVKVMRPSRIRRIRAGA